MVNPPAEGAVGHLPVLAEPSTASNNKLPPSMLVLERHQMTLDQTIVWTPLGHALLPRDKILRIINDTNAKKADANPLTRLMRLHPTVFRKMLVVVMNSKM